MSNLDAIHSLLSAAVERRKWRKFEFFKPHPKQADFLALGATHQERLLRAGNQLGKTETGAAEMAYHLTGEYPEPCERFPNGWQGRRFTSPVRAWYAGVNGKDVRDISQAKLVGPPDIEAEWGTGYIPKEAIVGRTLVRGASNAIDTIAVRHKPSGGISTAKAKTYEAGSKTFRGEPVHVIWMDEEDEHHSMEIYTECLARLTTTSGIIYTTFTPQYGNTPIVKRFTQEGHQQCAQIRMGLKDALHLTPVQIEAALSRYPEWERATRLEGEALLGHGAAFTTPYTAITVPRPAYIPNEWAKIWGIDFGISHPFAAALLAWDRDLDILYLLHCMRMANSTPDMHVPAMRAIASEVPVAWPHDGHNRDKGSGDVLAQRYRKPGPGRLGLKMLPTHSTWPEGGFSTEAAVTALDDRCKTGRFLCVDTCEPFLEEYRNYHRKNGEIVKLNDDVLSAIFKGIMMLRYARPGGLGVVNNFAAARRRPMMAAETDPWTGQPIHS